MTEAGCCGYRGTDGEGILGVWYTADGCSFVQVLGTNVVVLRRKLAGVGIEPTDGAGKVGADGKDFGKGRSR